MFGKKKRHFTIPFANMELISDDVWGPSQIKWFVKGCFPWPTTARDNILRHHTSSS